MNAKNLVFSLTLAVAGALLFLQPAYADTCTTQYGGTTTCVPTDLTINKLVKHPTSGVFVENLTASDTPYSAGSDVLFKLTIKNGSGETFQTGTAKDKFPEHPTF